MAGFTGTESGNVEVWSFGGGAPTVEALAPQEAPILDSQGVRLRKVSIIDPTKEGFSGVDLGFTKAKLEDNTPDDQTAEYVKLALARGLPEFRPALCRHDGTMVIVGSGPSVANHVEGIRAGKARGRPVMAIKGAHDWLIERDITPDLWVSMDSQDSIVEGVRRKSKEVGYLVASKVSPVVFDWLADQQVTLWHGWFGRGEEKLYPEGANMIGGGSTSGLRGITLAFLMGFRRVMLFGFDSCLAGKVKRVDGSKASGFWTTMRAGIEGPERICDFSMASQAAEFQAMTLDIMPGLKVKVVGDGLIADIMAERARLGFNDWED